MTVIRSLFTTIRENRRPSTRVRLALESLDARTLPATGGGGGPPGIVLEVEDAKALVAKADPFGAVSPTPPEVEAGLLDPKLAEVFQDIQAAQEFEALEQIRQAADALLPGGDDPQAQSPLDAAAGLLGRDSPTGEGSDRPSSPLDAVRGPSEFHFGLRPDSSGPRDPDEIVGSHGSSEPSGLGDRWEKTAQDPVDEFRERTVRAAERYWGGIGAILGGRVGGPVGATAGATLGAAFGRLVAEAQADELERVAEAAAAEEANDADEREYPAPEGSTRPVEASEETMRLRRMIFTGGPVIDPNPELSGGPYSYDGWLLGIPPKERQTGPPDRDGGPGAPPDVEVPTRHDPLELVSWVAQPIPVP